MSNYAVVVGRKDDAEHVLLFMPMTIRIIFPRFVWLSFRISFRLSTSWKRYRTLRNDIFIQNCLAYILSLIYPFHFISNQSFITEFCAKGDQKHYKRDKGMDQPLV